MKIERNFLLLPLFRAKGFLGATHIWKFDVLTSRNFLKNQVEIFGGFELPLKKAIQRNRSEMEKKKKQYKNEMQMKASSKFNQRWRVKISLEKKNLKKNMAKNKIELYLFFGYIRTESWMLLKEKKNFVNDFRKFV